jgi:integrase
VIRKHREKQGPKMFEARELQKMIKGAGQPLRSMILLGINCGFGNGDVAAVPIGALDLKGGWVRFPRPKTGIDRRVPLWPETVKAIRDWLKHRPAPKDPADAGVLFITYKRGRWDGEDGRSLPHEMRKLLDRLGIDGRRGFYCLRHTFQTIADECGDFIAVRKIMGHATSDIGDAYRERISDERLRKVTDFVRARLFR